tara:strand:+ start:801 stop:1115 length:315 start_codon:yes stop_codon:yes gene_type:complete
MKMKWHDDSEAFLLFGAELNKVIAALQYLSDKNPNVEGMNKFIQRLRNMSSYDQMLDKLIFKTARKLKEDPPKTKDEALTDSMTLDEILYRFELDLPKGKNGKN